MEAKVWQSKPEHSEYMYTGSLVEKEKNVCSGFGKYELILNPLQ